MLCVGPQPNKYLPLHHAKDGIWIENKTDKDVTPPCGIKHRINSIFYPYGVLRGTIKRNADLYGISFFLIPEA
jgi:hypothetical protein